MLSVAHWISFSNPPLTAEKEVARLPFSVIGGKKPRRALFPVMMQSHQLKIASLPTELHPSAYAS